MADKFKQAIESFTSMCLIVSGLNLLFVTHKDIHPLNTFPPTAVSASDDLDNLLEEFWNWRLENSPEYGTKFGINNHDDKLEIYTEEAFTKQKVIFM